jgi:hypothetical protein
MNDALFLDWVADRLTMVHGDDKNLDFIDRLRRMARRAAGGEIPKTEPKEWVYHFHAEAYVMDKCFAREVLHRDGLIHSNGPVNTGEAYNLTRENIRQSMPGPPTTITVTSFVLLHGPRGLA